MEEPAAAAARPAGIAPPPREPESEEAGSALPELGAVPWRRRASQESLRSIGRLWTAWTVALTVPFVLVAGLLISLEPLTAPVAVASLAHAWIIPELYASRGATAARPRQRRPPEAESVALGLLGDLLGHEARELRQLSGLALEQARLGTWLVGERGALLVSPGGRRVHCFCVGATDRELPPADHTAHLLLALRADEQGFATVANHAFSGAPWRVRRRLSLPQRPALDAACALERRRS